MTQHILELYGDATQVDIDHYKSVFNRSRQVPGMQRQSRKLILATRKETFLYQGSGNCQDFNYDNFYYNTPILNCPFGCEYCYLQGMYNSANIVIFVNTQDFIEATKEAVIQRPNPDQPLYLCISYDSDLLGIESLTGICRDWIAYAATEPNLVVEIRTKSASFAMIKDLEPNPNVILAWTVSPDVIQKRYEPGTPLLKRRIAAAHAAAEAGWPVRLCFDPVIPVPEWKEIYSAHVHKTFEAIAPDSIRDVSVGAFRMNRDFFDNIRKRRPNSGLYYLPEFEKTGDLVTVPEPLQTEIIETMVSVLTQYIDREAIAVWT